MRLFKRSSEGNDPFDGVELGDVLKDTITGYEGVCVARAQYLTGCNQVALSPKVKDGGEPQSNWFDIERVVVVTTGEVTVTPRQTGCDVQPPSKRGPSL